MTDVEPKTPKRKSLAGQNKKSPAKKPKLDNAKTPQKAGTPKGQNKKIAGNVQNSPPKSNKKNKRNSESGNDSTKKLKPFPGTKPTDDNTQKSEKRKNRSRQLKTLQLKIRSGDKQEALKTIEAKIKDIEGRSELSKTAKKKLSVLKKLQEVATGEAQEQPQVKKAPQNKSNLTKAQQKKNAKAPQNQVAQQKAAAASNDVKTNGKANRNVKGQNKPAAKKQVPQQQAEESDESDEEEDVEEEEDDSEVEEEASEEGSDQEGLEEDSGEESDEEEEAEEEGSEDESEEESAAPVVQVQNDVDVFDEIDLGEEEQEESAVSELEEEEQSDSVGEETPEYEEANWKTHSKNPRIREQKVQNSDANKNDKGKAIDLEQLKKNDLVAKNQKRFVLFVGNIPYDTNKLDLVEHFKKSGEIKDVRIPTDQKNSKPRGFAYVELGNEEAYQKCMSMHHTFLKGRRINVLYSQGGKKKGEDKKKEIKVKNFKLHAMRQQGKLAGSVKQSQRRSFRRAKQRGGKTQGEEQ